MPRYSGAVPVQKVPTLTLPTLKPSASVNAPHASTARASGATAMVSDHNATSSPAGSRTARAGRSEMQERLFSREPWRGMIDGHKQQQKADYAAAVQMLKEQQDARAVAVRRAARKGEVLTDPVVAKPLPSYAKPVGTNRTVRLPALELAARGEMPEPLPPTPTDFELLQRTGAGLTARRRDQAASPKQAQTVTSPRRRLSPRQSPTRQLTMNEIDALATEAPGRFIQQKLALLRRDKAEFEGFRQRVEAAEDERAEERRQRARELAPALEVSRRPLDVAGARARELERQERARQAFAEVARDVRDQRLATLQQEEERMQRSEAVRYKAQTDRFRVRKWLVALVLMNSAQGFLSAWRRGYRERWIRLLVTYTARHWYRRMLRRRDTFESLRLNYFLRRNLPNMVESFRWRRCVAATPLVRVFLQQYTAAMTFTLTVRNFLRRVRMAQAIVRRRRVVREVMLVALRSAWDRQCDVMRREYTLLMEIPPQVRDMMLRKVIQAEAAAFGQARHHVIAEWAKYRELFADGIRARLEAQGRRRSAMALMAVVGRRDASSGPLHPYHYLHDGRARSAFVEKQYAGSRAFFDADPSASQLDPADDVPYNDSDRMLEFLSGRRGPDGDAKKDLLLSTQEQATHLARHKADARMSASQRGGPAPATRALHPSMRFGGRKAAPKASAGAESPADLALRVTPGSFRECRAASPGGLTPGGTSKLQRASSSVHEAVAAGKEKLFNQQRSAAGNPHSSAKASPSTTHLSPSPQPRGRRRSLAFASPEASEETSPWHVPMRFGQVDEEWLMKLPPLPRRKLLCRPRAMEAFIVAARDALFAGVQQYREDEDRRLALEATPSDGATPAVTPPPGTSGTPPPPPKRYVRKHGNNEETFRVPDAFATDDELFVCRYVDFSWIAGFVGRVAPSYGPHGHAGSTAGPTREFIAQQAALARSQVKASRERANEAAAAAAAAAQSPPLARAPSFARRGSQRLL